MECSCGDKFMSAMIKLEAIKHEHCACWMRLFSTRPDKKDNKSPIDLFNDSVQFLDDTQKEIEYGRMLMIIAFKKCKCKK